MLKPRPSRLASGPAILLTVAALASITIASPFAAPAPVGGTLPFEFVPGQPARADEVNQNFDAVVALVADLQTQIDVLEARLAETEAKTGFLSVVAGDINGLSGPHLLVEGANLHVRSGSGSTDDGGASTGLGNLVIGYNEAQSGQAGDDRTGAHNLVLGMEHEFTSTAGIVAGLRNRITAPFASVLAGTNNAAGGAKSCVSGGAFNQANGDESSVSGGVSNFASALRAAASGGAQNTVSGIAASISGGSGGAAGGFASSISGGQSGIASGDQSTVTGGQSNSAFGAKSAISGGFNVSLSNDFDWRACDVTCQ